MAGAVQFNPARRPLSPSSSLPAARNALLACAVTLLCARPHQTSGVWEGREPRLVLSKAVASDSCQLHGQARASNGLSAGQ